MRYQVCEYLPWLLVRYIPWVLQRCLPWYLKEYLPGMLLIFILGGEVPGSHKSLGGGHQKKKATNTQAAGAIYIPIGRRLEPLQPVFILHLVLQ